MPRKGQIAPNWDLLGENSAHQQGFFTLTDAQEAGVSSALLAHHVRTGKVERIYRGVYRFPHVPRDEHEDLTALWLLSARQGVFSHETALSLLQLSDVLPPRVHLSLPTRWRRRGFPAHVEPHFPPEMPADVQWFGPVPITGPLRTIQDCRHAHTSPELLVQAVAQASARGLLSRDDLATLDQTEQRR